jgi:hypothetical protein
MRHHCQPAFTAEPGPNRPIIPTAIVDARAKLSWRWMLLPCLLGRACPATKPASLK